MARQWVEFIQSQNIVWERDDLSGVRPGIEVKILSRDDKTGAVSMLTRFPAGYSAAATAMTVDEEFLVLEGTVHFGEQRYDRYGYAHWPAGYPSGAVHSEEGAVLLHFLSGTPQVMHSPPNFDARRTVDRLDAFEVPYTGNFHPEFPIGAGRKVLFTDPNTGDTTWILGTMPLRWAARPEVHPVVEEMYLLSGEVHGNCGVMRPGAYFWRPPGKTHGPYGSLTGNVYFFRTKGGPLSTEYVDHGTAFKWWPDYSPILPKDLEYARGETLPAVSNW